MNELKVGCRIIKTKTSPSEVDHNQIVIVNVRHLQI